MEPQDTSRKPSTRAKVATAFTNEMGRIPPQAIELEQVVLGAMMLERNAVNDTIDILNEQSFYDPKHQYIFKAIRDLFASTNPVDLVTVTERLAKNGELTAAGGVGYVSQLTNRVASSAHIQYHARIIAEKFIKRELIRVSSDILKDAFDDTVDVFDLLNKAETGLFQIGENNMTKQVNAMSSVVKDAIEEIEKARAAGDGVSGIPSGFIELDKITSGWQRSDMIVVAARPGMGKTAFVLSAARNTAVEHGKGDLADHEFHQLHARIPKLTTAPIFIDDSPGLSIFDFRAKCRRLKAQHNIELVIIDYLQLMSAKDGRNNGNREQEISTISRSIKEIAKELNIPIIALAQLSRSVEQRAGDKKPMLSDLRESGAIEQDADIVSFLYRPEYYKIYKDDHGNSTQDMAEFIIAKHRNGKTDTVRMRFEAKYARFENMNDASSLGDFGESNTSALSSFNQDSNTITIQSKMNKSDKDFNFDGDQTVPF